jgi:hypothetical protein
MQYRYKLKNDENNKGKDSRTLEGFAFFKNKWLYSSSPLPVNNFLKYLDMETAPSKGDFVLRDEEKKKKIQERNRQAGQELLKNRIKKEKPPVKEEPVQVVEESKPIVEPLKEEVKEDIIEEDIKKVVEPSKKELNSMLKKELYKIAIEKGFTEKELKGLKKSDLVELLTFDEIMEEEDE